ncbi:unnamed protein product [Rotaria socialis]|nr:unnamed protein product [Rotaria socialis]CAF4741082.1 unnamed protein product [Rotaria socialis]
MDHIPRAIHRGTLGKFSLEGVGVDVSLLLRDTQTHTHTHPQALAKLSCTPPSTVWRGVTKDLSAQFPPATPVTWWSFTSCTTTLTVLENNMYLGDTGNRTLFSVEAINGRSIRAHSHFNSEDEVLLLPGTQMVVQSRLKPAPDLHIIQLKQVIPEEVLFEPPFEGALLYPKTG